MALDEQEILKLINTVCRTETLRQFSVTSCVASTRVLTDVLQYFGHSSEPLPVTVVAMNEGALEQLHQGVPVEDWPQDAWSVGVVGTGVSENKRWDGHLVAIVDGKWLVDPSLDQASRPQRGLKLDPCVLDATSWTDKAQRATWRSENGIVLVYQQMTNPGNWRSSPDWALTKPATRRSVRDAVARSIRLLKPLLAVVA